MTPLPEKTGTYHGRERLTEAYEVAAYRDQSEQPQRERAAAVAVPHPEPRELEFAKERVLGHGEQRVIPDDCQFGDNDMCYVEA